MPNPLFSIPLSCRRLAEALLFLMSLLVAAPTAQAVDDDLKRYAQQCVDKIPLAVPNFNCMDGVVVPMDGTPGGRCDAPPYLPGAGCYKYSRIGDLGSTAHLGMVFMCRHKMEVREDDNTRWQDIAVVQTNFDTGATCFYQQLDDAGHLSGLVQSPATGEGPWLTPKTMALEANACVQCHDNGPLLRTPYLKAVQNQVPIFAHFAERNKSRELRAKYWFPGSEFLFYESGKNWNGNVLRVKDTSTGLCTTCHEMGVTRIDDAVGTSTWLGPYSTGADPTPFLQHGAGFDGDLAYWMQPSLKQPSDGAIIKSQTLRECARKTVDTLTCTHTIFDGELTELGNLAHKAVLHAAAPEKTP